MDALHAQGVAEAQLYGADESVYGGLNAFFLLMDKPEAYGLPNAENAVLPSRNNARGYLATLVTAALAVIGGLIALRRRREPARSGAVARLTGTSRPRPRRSRDMLADAEHFVRGPEWTWYILFYFFLAGLSGGSYVARHRCCAWPASRADEPAARVGYYVAFVALLPARCC